MKPRHLYAVSDRDDYQGDNPWIQTATGGQFHPLQPRIEEIRIEDIAHALAHQCRFTGHTKRFYSVAEHSWLVSCVVEPAYALHGLLHDASEAYLVDLPSPLKRAPQFRSYREAEARLQRLIYQRFGLGPEEPADVKHADNVVFATELRDLMEPLHADWKRHTLEPIQVEISGLSPDEARELFLHKFRELYKGS